MGPPAALGQNPTVTPLALSAALGTQPGCESTAGRVRGATVADCGAGVLGHAVGHSPTRQPVRTNNAARSAPKMILPQLTGHICKGRDMPRAVSVS